MTDNNFCFRYTHSFNKLYYPKMDANLAFGLNKVVCQGKGNEN